MARPTTGFDSITLKVPLAAEYVADNRYATETINIPLAGAQTTGTGKATVLVGVAGEITDIRAYAGTAPTGAALILDVNKNGTTLFTDQANRPTIAISANASSATDPAVTSVAAGDRLSIDVDQVGSSVAGSDLSIAVSIRRLVTSGYSVETIPLAVTGTLSAGAGQGTVLVGVAGEITDIRAYVGTAPTGAALIVDVNKNGTTVFTTQADRPTVAIGASVSSAVVPAVTSVAAGDRLSIDIDQVGSSVAGSNLYVAISLRRLVAA